MSSSSSRGRPLFRTMITTCCPYRVEAGPYFVPILPHMLSSSSRGRPLISYQDHHMLLLTLRRRRAAARTTLLAAARELERERRLYIHNSKEDKAPEVIHINMPAESKSSHGVKEFLAIASSDSECIPTEECFGYPVEWPQLPKRGGWFLFALRWRKRGRPDDFASRAAREGSRGASQHRRALRHARCLGLLPFLGCIGRSGEHPARGPCARCAVRQRRPKPLPADVRRGRPVQH